MLHDRSKHLAGLGHPLAPEKGDQDQAHDSAHIWLAGSKFGEDMLHHKVFHTPLDLGMAHNEWAKCRRNVQRPEFLRRRRVPGTGYISRARYMGSQHSRTKDVVHKMEHGQECDLGSNAGQREDERNGA